MELYKDKIRARDRERQQAAVCPEDLQPVITGGIMLVYLMAKLPESSTPTAHLLCTYYFCAWQRGEARR